MDLLLGTSLLSCSSCYRTLRYFSVILLILLLYTSVLLCYPSHLVIVHFGTALLSFSSCYRTLRYFSIILLILSSQASVFLYYPSHLVITDFCISLLSFSSCYHRLRNFSIISISLSVAFLISYLSFSVTKVIIANNMPSIQNRVTILDSCTPLFW